MHRFDSYHGQTVLEQELDDMFDDCENAELNLALDTGHAQVDDGASPGPSVYGGILSGLTVTAVAGNDYVTIAGGKARDNLGQRIYTGATASTVKVSNVGITDVATVGSSSPYTPSPLTDAVCDGAAISGITVGKYTVASLWLVYAEQLSDVRVDLLGANVSYNVAESFKFEIAIGDAAGYVHATVVAGGATPNRSALIDGKVLLADVILYNNGGNIEIATVTPTVCVKDEDWDDLTGNYANLAGRRSDWIALDQGADFPQNAAQGTETRAGSAREAIYDVVKKLQAQAAPDGASMVGVQASTTTYKDIQPYISPTAIAAGSVESALLTLANAINRKATRGADLVRPLTDDFMRCSRAAFDAWDPDAENPQIWGKWNSAGGVLGLLGSVGGGAVRLTTNAVPAAHIGIQSGYTSVGGASPDYWWFAKSGYPYPSAGIRLRLPDITGHIATFGFWSAAGATAHLDIDCTGASPVTTLALNDGTLSGPFASGDFGFTITAGAWLEFWLWFTDEKTVNIRSVLDDNTQIYPLGGALNFGTSPFAFRAYIATVANAKQLDIDTITISDYLSVYNLAAGLYGRPVG